ncbi:MAG: FAD binding domain-containing protein [Anaerolineae bacterium]|nr:FAD binding domain-containing protein [Anaerolineae bacterium]
MLRNVKNYHRPTTVEEAVAVVQSNPNALYLSGGAWIVAQGDPVLETVVDLQAAGLDGLEGSLDGVRIGATTKLQTIIDHPDAGTLAGGILATAAAFTQSRTLREQGTLGGTLIVAGPEDPLTTALLVLDADIRYADPAVHTAPFPSFVAYRDRLVKTRVLLTELWIKRPPARSAGAFEVVGRSPKDKPIVCAAAYVAVEEGLPADIRVAVGGANPIPTRLHKTEHLLKGQLLTVEKIDKALAASLVELKPAGDFRGSVEYRKEMAKVLSRRALLAAWEQARRA